jgi:hypothetical protein
MGEGGWEESWKGMGKPAKIAVKGSGDWKWFGEAFGRLEKGIVSGNGKMWEGKI